jgi:L,D-transpeptidase catalytic domain
MTLPHIVRTARGEWRVAVIMIGFIVSLCVSVVAHAEPAKKYPGPCEIVYPSDATVEWDCRRLRRGDSLEQLFGERWLDVARFNRIDRRHARSGVSLKVPRNLEGLDSLTPLPLFYQAAETDEQFILVDLSEQFLGAYEYGALRFALPIATGNGRDPTPTGMFRLTAAHRVHQSNLYTIEGTDRPYPMNYALRFHVNRAGVSYWIHGRDLPGYPASHGCIGLYDEWMQKEQYGIPKEPELNDAKRLFEWVLGGEVEDDTMIPLSHGPKVHIIGQAPGTLNP